MLVDLKYFVIFLESLERLRDHLWTVWGLLSRAGVPLKLKMWFFFEDRIDFFGYVIQPGLLDKLMKATDTICVL